LDQYHLARSPVAMLALRRQDNADEVSNHNSGVRAAGTPSTKAG